MKAHGSSLVADARSLEEAANWMLRLNAEDAAADEIMGWVRWCEADPANQDAFDRVQALWRMAGALQYDDSAASTIIQVDTRRHPTSYGRRRRRRRTGLASISGRVARRGLAACLVAAVSLLWLTSPVTWQTRADHGRLVSKQGPVSSRTLSDGSKVDLATGSAVEVNYTAGVRALELQSGEAYFSVGHNPDRPFVVNVGALRVRAVGTAFNVRKAGERVVVTVTEGQVEVSPTRRVDGWAGDRVVHLDAGQQLRWDAGLASAIPVPIRLEGALAWRRGRLEYTSEPLHAVIADLNRYSSLPIVVVGDEIRGLRFSGTVLTPSVNQWLQGLPDIFPVVVQRQNDVFVIQARNTGRPDQGPRSP